MFHDQRKHYDLSSSAFDSLDPTQKKELANSIYARAQVQFSYMYKSYPIFDLVESGTCSPLLEEFFAFLNSNTFLGTIRRITKIQNIEFADAQVTHFEPGHFLTSHNDSVEGKNRLVAYVYNLTPDWHPDWGGNLMFYDDNKNVVDVFVPKFNSLSLFAVGAQHAVALVSPFARRPRLAISGWLRFR